MYQVNTEHSTQEFLLQQRSESVPAPEASRDRNVVAVRGVTAFSNEKEKSLLWMFTIYHNVEGSSNVIRAVFCHLKPGF